jgi:hypothetical protein
MMRGACLGLALLMLPAMSRVAGAEHMHDDHRQLAISAPIRITINPEARVSVTMAAELPPPAPCGTAVDLAVSVLNHGFVTAQLEAYWVGDAPPGARLEFHPEPLSGATQELHSLKIYLAHPGPTDLAIAFKARDDVPDMGGRNHVHFLMSCTGTVSR